jgi:hypothetical protein
MVVVGFEGIVSAYFTEKILSLEAGQRKREERGAGVLSHRVSLQLPMKCSVFWEARLSDPTQSQLCQNNSARR